jgi:hypothetical protein
MARSFAVFGLAFAGVFLLAGTGWALVAGACLVLVLWRKEPDWQAFATRARALAGRVRVAPRRSVAVGGMTAGLVAAPAGAGLAWGAGAGLLTAGMALIGLALLTGWNTA